MVIFALAVLAVIFVRLRLLTIPLERDEGEFAYGGQLMLQGIPPYQLFYNMKFPGIYAAYAFVMWIFGQTPAGIHLGLLAVNLTCIVLLYRIALRWLNPDGAAVAAASYAVLSTSPVVFGLAAHATHFVVAASLGGLLLLLRALESGKNWMLFLSGILMGLSCLMKQPGAMFGLFGLFILVWNRTRHRVTSPAILLYLTGGLIILALTAASLLLAGVWKRFWFWTVVYAKVHATQYPFSAGWEQLMDVIRSVPLFGDGLLWIAAGAGLIWLCSTKPAMETKIWFGGLLFASIVAVSGDFYYSRHYFVMLLPVVGLLVGVAYVNFVRWSAAGTNAGISILLALVFLCNHAVLFSFSPAEACWALYNTNPFVEAPKIAQMLAEHSAPNARIAILGSEPEIFFYARRHSATGYIYVYDFFEPQPYAVEMQKEMMSEIEKAQPEFLLWVRVPTSWDTWPTAERVKTSPIMAWLPKFQRQFYDIAGLVVVNEMDSEFHWGKDALPPWPHGDVVVIFKHK